VNIGGNSWFGAVPAGVYSIYFDADVTRSHIMESYLSHKESGGAGLGVIFVDGETVKIHGNRIVQGAVAPTNQAIVLGSGSQFVDVDGNTFEGFSTSKDISDAGTNNRIGPNYNDAYGSQARFHNDVRSNLDFLGRRFKASVGTALVAGDFGTNPTANWGAGAAYSAIIGTDQGFSLTLTAAGTPGANPTIPYTYKDGTWGSSPIFICKQVGGTGAIADITGENTATATTMTLTWNGTPIAGLTYVVNCLAMGR
jgi:hypothetical protein